MHSAATWPECKLDLCVYDTRVTAMAIADMEKKMMMMMRRRRRRRRRERRMAIAIAMVMVMAKLVVIMEGKSRGKENFVAKPRKTKCRSSLTEVVDISRISRGAKGSCRRHHVHKQTPRSPC